MVLEPAHARKLKVTEWYFKGRAFFGFGKTAMELLKRASENDYALQVFNKQIRRFSEPIDSEDPLFRAAILLFRMRHSVEDWRYYALQAKSYRDMYVKLLKQMRDRGVFTDYTLPENGNSVVEGCVAARTLAELE
jgi:hypothetical protein